MVPTRLMHDASAPAAWNMAVDDAILESVAAGGLPCLRFFGWTPPALSLGYFQKYALRSEHTSSSALPVVRRTTGGGAIVHDQELTYSLAVSSKTRFSRAGTQLVANVHQALTRALAQWNIAVTLHGPLPSNGPRDKSFLCFQRRAAEDVVLAEHKICGSALRQRRCATLLHGSVLVGASRYAAELPGINDLAGRPVVGVDLREAWTQELATALELSLEHDALTAGEQQRARQLESRRYATEAWTQKR